MYKIVNVSDIKIRQNFLTTPPKEHKMYMCRTYFHESGGRLDRDIVLDEYGWLVDGYVAYLVLKENNVEKVVAKVVPARPKENVPYATYVYGSYYPGGKEYIWMLPIGKEDKFKNLKPGDKALVFTKHGARNIIVSKISSMSGVPISCPIREVIRCLNDGKSS